MYHTAAYSQSVTNSLTNTTVNALADNVFKIGSQNGFVLQEDMMLLFAEVAPNNATAARLQSPKLAQFGYLQLTPLQTAAKTANGILIASWPYRPFTFRNQEEVVAYVDTGGAAAAVETIVVNFSNGVDPIPAGEELTIKFTSTTTATANAWTLLSMTLSQTLPEGRYAMLGSEVQSTNAIFHRWTFWGQFYRPGMPSTTAYTNQQYPGARDYRNGLLGMFSNVTLPNCEVLASAGDTSHTGFMHVIKVA
jgi:hypothetical protein